MKEREKKSTGFIVKVVIVLNTLMALSSVIDYAVNPLFATLTIAAAVVLGIICIIMYVVNPYFKAFRYYMCCYFGLVYCLYMYFTPYKQMFVVGIIANVSILLLHDVVYTLFTAAAIVMANIGLFVLLTVQGKIPYQESIAYIWMILVYIIVWIRVIAMQSRFSKEDAEKIKAFEEKQQAQIDELKTVSQKMSDMILALNGRAEKLKKVMKNSKEAVQNIADATNDNAVSIQSQTALTSQIHTIIEDVRGSINEIRVKTTDSVDVAQKGQSAINDLNAKTDIIVADNEKIVKQMQDLVNEVGNIRGITDTITSISNSTNLLALNASIEAARVGAEGRGFAVVADEIRQLADNTKNSTQLIEDMLESFLANIENMQEIINATGQNIVDENRLMQQVNEYFAVIDNDLNDTQSLSVELEKKSDYLWDCNQNVVDQINNLSATSEEVSAQSQETTKTQDYSYDELVDFTDELEVLVGVVAEL